MTSHVWRSVVSLTLAAVGMAGAQTDSDARSLLARAQAATERYKDQAVAIADGYRAMGPEAPAMGQHWVHPGLLVAARMEAEHPAILEYVTVHGAPVLAGVAYALPLGPGELPPQWPDPRSAWHSHRGGLEEEGSRLEHDEAAPDLYEDRVAVLHAWIWVENPAGPFVPLNWALPFVRAGFAPGAAPSASAKALSLGDGGTAFWAAGLQHAIGADVQQAGRIRAALDAYGDTVTAWCSQRAGGARLTDADASWLAAVWERARSAVLATLDAAGREHASMLSGF